MLSRRAVLVTGACALAVGGAEAGTAERILILGGDLAEIAFALGAAERVVATDETAIWPPEAEALPKVGYLRRLSAEGILSLRPDLVIASANAGPPTAMAQITAAGLPVAVAPDGDGFDAVGDKIRFVGEVLGLPAPAQTLADDVAREMASVRAALADVTERPSVLFLISLAGGTPVAAGTDTAADAMIRLARGSNAVAGFTGYKPLSAEAAIGLAPEFLLLPDHAAEAAGGASAVSAAAGLAATPAGRAGQVVVMDSMKLLGFGPRTPAAVAELAGSLHPAIAHRFGS